MENGPDLEHILEIALRAHKGQKDLDGKPYILHPLAVGLMGSDDLEMAVGFLHDTVEDTAMTYDDLRAEGVPEEVIEALRLCTRPREMPYDDYLTRILESGNRTAIRVKMNDLRHNLERGRLSELDNPDPELRERLRRINEKHEKAMRRFEGAEG